ncbi:MAG: hypothetical protein ACYC6M_15520, partial [Terriglobales bacterium]
NTPGFNSWAMKTVVSNPDGSTDTVYTNFIAEVMLDDHYDPASALHTDEFYAYNTQAQLIRDAAPSAVTAAEFSRIGAGRRRKASWRTAACFTSTANGNAARCS